MYFSGQRKYAILCLVAFVACFTLGQEESATEEKGVVKNCESPKFEVKQLVSTVFQVKITSETKQRFLVWIDSDLLANSNKGEKVLQRLREYEVVHANDGESNNEEKNYSGSYAIETINDYIREALFFCDMHKTDKDRDEEDSFRKKDGDPPVACYFAQMNRSFLVSASKKGNTFSVNIDPEILRQSHGIFRIYWFAIERTGGETICDEFRLGSKQVTFWSRTVMGLDAGGAFGLAEDGSWENFIQASFRSETFLTKSMTVGSSFEYVASGKISSGTTEDPPMEEGAADDDALPRIGRKTTENTTSDPLGDFNPFDSSGGTFRANVYGMKSFGNPAILHLVAGGGITATEEETTTTDPETMMETMSSKIITRNRWFTGIRFRVWRSNVLSDDEDPLKGSTAFLEVGYARDDLYANRDRYFAMGEVMLGSFESSVFKLKVWLDAPVNGEGESDIKVGGVLRWDPRKIFTSNNGD